MAHLRIIGLIVVSALTVGAAVGAPASPYCPPFGLDLTAFDKTAQPGNDFFQYANGGYLARTVIPPDQPMATRRSDMTDRIEIGRAHV